MNHIIQDERYYVVEEAIIDSFLLILKDKDINKITVSDVIKKAGIVRSTFYNHYENIADLVSSMEDKTIHDIFTLMETFHPKNDQEICYSYFLALCDYTITNPFLSSLLGSPRINAFFEKTMTMFHNYVSKATQNSSLEGRSKEEFSYMIACTIGCTVGILHKWTRDNLMVPKEEIAIMLTRTFLKGMYPYMS